MKFLNKIVCVQFGLWLFNILLYIKYSTECKLLLDLMVFNVYKNSKEWLTLKL